MAIFIQYNNSHDLETHTDRLQYAHWIQQSKFSETTNPSIHDLPFFILFVTSNHRTTNLVSPDFFPEFFSVWAVEKESKVFIGPKQVSFLFHLLKLRKNCGKNCGKQYSWFGGLMSRTRHTTSFVARETKQIIFSNFSCMFLNPNNFFQFEF